MPSSLVPWTRYLRAYLAMLALGALSLVLSTLHLGGAFTAFSLVVAAVMAAVTTTVLMHLDVARFSIVLVPVAVVFYVALLVGLLAVEVAARRTFPEAPVESFEEPFGE